MWDSKCHLGNHRGKGSMHVLLPVFPALAPLLLMSGKGTRLSTLKDIIMQAGPVGSSACMPALPVNLVGWLNSREEYKLENTARSMWWLASLPALGNETVLSTPLLSCAECECSDLTSKATRSLGAQIAGHWILLENIWEYYAVPATLKFKVNVNSRVACQSILRQAEHHNILLDLSTVFKVNLAL